ENDGGVAERRCRPEETAAAMRSASPVQGWWRDDGLRPRARHHLHDEQAPHRSLAFGFGAHAPQPHLQRHRLAWPQLGLALARPALLETSWAALHDEFVAAAFSLVCEARALAAAALDLTRDAERPFFGLA